MNSLLWSKELVDGFCRICSIIMNDYNTSLLEKLIRNGTGTENFRKYHVHKTQNCSDENNLKRKKIKSDKYILARKICIHSNDTIGYYIDQCSNKLVFINYLLQPVVEKSSNLFFEQIKTLCANDSAKKFLIAKNVIAKAIIEQIHKSVFDSYKIHVKQTYRDISTVALPSSYHLICKNSPYLLLESLCSSDLAFLMEKKYINIKNWIENSTLLTNLECELYKFDLDNKYVKEVLKKEKKNFLNDAYFWFFHTNLTENHTGLFKLMQKFSSMPFELNKKLNKTFKICNQIMICKISKKIYTGLKESSRKIRSDERIVFLYNPNDFELVITLIKFDEPEKKNIIKITKDSVLILVIDLFEYQLENNNDIGYLILFFVTGSKDCAEDSDNQK